MRKIILLLTLILLVSGCSEVQLSPRYQQVLEMSAINVRAMCKDCEKANIEYVYELLEKVRNAPTPSEASMLIDKAFVLIKALESCEKGLELSANLLDYIVDASYGRASDANDR